MFLTSVLPQTSRGIAIASVASSLTAHVAAVGVVVWLAATASSALLDARLTSRPGAALTVTIVTPSMTEAVEQPVTVTPTQSLSTPETVTPDAATPLEAASSTSVVASPTSQPVSLNRTPAPPAQFVAVVSPDVAGPQPCEDGLRSERQNTAEFVTEPQAENAPFRPRPRTERPAAKPPATSLVAIPVVAGVTSQEGPAFLDNPPPEYPSIALTRRWQGEVVVRVWIDIEGRVRRAELDRSSGHEVLDEAALKAVRQWRARPAREHGRAVETVQLQPIVFRLDRRGS